MHNGMLRFVGEKMSKSLGNVVTLRAALDEWGRETLLVLFLSGHWRKPLDYSNDVLAQAAAQTEAFRNVFRGPSSPEPDGAWERFAASLEDDFNTAGALAVLHGWRDHDLLRKAFDVFGLGSLAVTAEAPEEVVALAERREQARVGKDFAESDRLRDEIAVLGWDVRDESGGFQLVPR